MNRHRWVVLGLAAALAVAALVLWTGNLSTTRDGDDPGASRLAEAEILDSSRTNQRVWHGLVQTQKGPDVLATIIVVDVDKRQAESQSVEVLVQFNPENLRVDAVAPAGTAEPPEPNDHELRFEVAAPQRIEIYWTPITEYPEAIKVVLTTGEGSFTHDMRMTP